MNKKQSLQDLPGAALSADEKGKVTQKMTREATEQMNNNPRNSSTGKS